MIHFLVHDAVDPAGVAVVGIPAKIECAGRDLSADKPGERFARKATTNREPREVSA
jgi:hypothetical protein